MVGEIDDEALLGELGEPGLVGDVDIESAGSRHRIEGELLTDIVVRDGVEGDLDAGLLGEGGSALAIEFLVRRAGLDADRYRARRVGPADRAGAEIEAGACRRRARQERSAIESVCHCLFSSQVFFG